ncbi:MAG: acetylxylan esterase, partial [Verrucomicrobia bacterium]|nr:acetylxylan esterase [Verrucomicrobiota bacterium]
MGSKTMRKAISAGWVLACMAAIACGSRLRAEAPRALPPGQVPNDARLGPLKDLNGYFSFRPPSDAEAWRRRAEALRRRLRIVLGLWPTPSRASLRPRIYGLRDMGDYTVQKVYFESLPGFYVTGNLYRPARGLPPRPAVLCPHGHWANGRFHDMGEAAVRKAVEEGAEKFLEGGRNPIQARCVHLARMGFVVFSYDMIGYADSVQIPAAVAHRFAKQRPEMNDPENWGFFSPQAEMRYQSIMGLQTLDSFRSLDFLCELPDVDPGRIGVTGASGGGTQTFILCAVDPRPAAAFPAVMVSTAMQGGCTCENACGLRIGTGNVEIAALFAPKPLGMTCANDWTREMPVKGFPQLKRLYALLGAPEKTALFPFLQFGHNYNAQSRAAMYEWMRRFLMPGLQATPPERDYRRLAAEELTVWDAEHPRPKDGPEVERRICKWLTQDAEKQLRASWEDGRGFLALYRPAWAAVIGRAYEDAGRLSWRPAGRRTEAGIRTEWGLLRNATYGEELPATRLRPAKRLTKNVAVWICGRGKADLWREGGGLRAPVRRLVRAGWTVVSADLLYQGEFLKDGKPMTQARRVDNPRVRAAAQA